MSFQTVLIANAYSTPGSGFSNLIIDNSDPGATIDTTNATNVGGGVGVFSTKLGDLLQFRSFVVADSKLAVSQVGNTIQYSVNEGNLDVANMLNGADIVYKANTMTISNKTFNDTNNIYTALKFDNPAHTFKYSLQGDNITADRTINFGLLEQNDTFLYQNQAQSNIGGPKVFINQALKLQDSTGTKNLTFNTSVQGVNVNMTIPPLSASDDFVFNNNSAIIANKTINNSNGVAIDALEISGETDGDLIYRTSGAYTRLPAGSTNNILKISSGLPTWSSALTLSQTFYIDAYTRNALGAAAVSYFPTPPDLLSPATVPGILISQNITLTSLTFLILDTSDAFTITSGTITIEIGTRVNDAFVSGGTIATLSNATGANGKYYTSFTPGTYNLSAGSVGVIRATNSALVWGGSTNADIAISAIFATVV